MPQLAADKEAADAELRAILRQLKDDNGLTFDQLVDRAQLSRGTIGHYLNKPGHPRKTELLQQLLAALGASTQERERALALHRRTLRDGSDSAEVGWAARAKAAECTVWPMAAFTAAEARVHTAIGRRRVHLPGDQASGPELAPPRYVPRAHDVDLRMDIAEAAAGRRQALIVLRGSSSTGKTRSLFEAVQEVCSEWTVIRPRTALALRRLPESGLLDRRCVVWLNELQGFLGPNGHGLSLDVLRNLFASAQSPVVVVGTLWPEKLRLATAERDDGLSDSRALLTEWTPLVRWHDVPPTLTTDEEGAHARAFGDEDPRLAYAVADPDRFGFAQTLAGAHELLEHYKTAPPAARLLLEAAADARRLGHGHALTMPLLQDMALALWHEEYGPTRPDPGWFEPALTYASARLRSSEGVRALIPVDDLGAVEPTERTGYDLADYLEQQLVRSRRTRPVPDGLWDGLERHTSRPDDLLQLARSANGYSRYGYVEALYRKAGAAGDEEALFELAWWLADQPGRQAEAETVLQEAAPDEPTAHRAMLWSLLRRPMSDDEAEASHRRMATEGDPTALYELAKWLSGRPMREAETETAYRQAAATGHPTVLVDLARWLSGRPGQQAAAEVAYRQAAAVGEPAVLVELAWLISRWPGREAEAEAAYRKAAAAGSPAARDALVILLGENGVPRRPTASADSDSTPTALRQDQRSDRHAAPRR